MRNTRTPRPELERPWYFKLSYGQLEAIDDAESRFERGIRLTNAIDVPYNPVKGNELIASAAEMGHPVALAYVEYEDRCEEDPLYREGVELYVKSIARGHPYGEPVLRSLTR